MNENNIPIGVAYYSVHDPRLIELMAKALENSQRRWDTAQDLVAKTQGELLELPVDPKSAEGFSNFLQDTFESVKNEVENKYEGDYSRALDFIKESVMKARSVIPIAKQGYTNYEKLKNVYENLAVQGKTPVEYKRTDKGIVAEEIPFENFYRAPFLNYNPDTKKMVFNSSVPTITARGDYDSFFNNLINDIQNYGYSSRTYGVSEEGDAKLRKDTSYQGHDMNSFNKFLGTNTGKRWLEEAINNFIESHPNTVPREFIDKQSGEIDRELVKDYILDRVVSRLFRKTSSVVGEIPINTGNGKSPFGQEDSVLQVNTLGGSFSELFKKHILNNNTNELYSKYSNSGLFGNNIAKGALEDLNIASGKIENKETIEYTPGGPQPRTVKITEDDKKKSVQKLYNTFGFALISSGAARKEGDEIIITNPDKARAILQDFSEDSNRVGFTRYTLVNSNDREGIIKNLSPVLVDNDGNHPSLKGSRGFIIDYMDESPSLKVLNENGEEEEFKITGNGLTAPYRALRKIYMLAHLDFTGEGKVNITDQDINIINTLLGINIKKIDRHIFDPRTHKNIIKITYSDGTMEIIDPDKLLSIGSTRYLSMLNQIGK